MLKILIIDDEPRTRRRLAAIISQSELDVEVTDVASNGIDGLAKAKLLHPDIIITDVRMPQMDGILLSSEIKKFLPDCQIIFISGYSDKEYLRSAISLKAVCYVEKPFEPTEMLEAIRSAMDIIIENRRKTDILRQNQLLITEQKNLLGEKIALELLSPNTGDFYLKKLHSLYPKFTASSCFFTLICQLDYAKDTESGPRNALARIRQLLDENAPASLLAQKEANIFILQMCSASPDPVVIRNVIDSLFTDMQQAFSDTAEVFLAAGTPVTRLQQLYQSYTEAVLSRKKLFFMGYNNTCCFQEADNEIDKPFQLDNILLQKFETSLRNDHYKEAGALITKLFYNMRNPLHKYESSSIKNVYYSLLITIDSVCRERNIASVFPHGSDFIWETIAQVDTIFALQDYITLKLSLFSQAIAGKSDTSLLVHRILQYIEQHYGESNLSINKIAENLHFTPAYLCQIFKNELGVTINTYICNFRIRKAIELLKEKDTKLYEVSVRVGYSDQNYFSRQFKKQVGMPPSEFREKYFL